MARSVLSADHFHDEAAPAGLVDEHIWANGLASRVAGTGRLNGKLPSLACASAMSAANLSLRLSAPSWNPAIFRCTYGCKRSICFCHDSFVHTAIGQTFKGGYETVNHFAKEYVRDGAFTNTVEGYFSILKRGTHGVYHHVNEAHLYGFAFRYSSRIKLGIDDKIRTYRAVKGIVGKRLTYRTTRGQAAP